MVKTPWCGVQAGKLYLQSGQFTSTLKDSEAIGGIDTAVSGITYDTTNTPWCGDTADKLYLQSGQFTTTLKDSEDVSLTDISVQGISWDGTDTPWTGLGAGKFYLQSGQFTDVIKTSRAAGVDTPFDLSFDSTNTPWCGFTDDKLYLQSGQFTDVLKTSEPIGGIDATPQGISWDGTNTPWCGTSGSKIYLQSGQFSDTLLTSENIAVIDTLPTGICTNDIFGRLGLRIFLAEATETITFSDSTFTNTVYDRESPDTLTFTDEGHIEQARITRQLVNVLLQGDGDARVSRQLINILISATLEVEATDTLTFSDSSAREADFIRIAPDTLVFDQRASEAQDAEDTLVFTQESVGYGNQYFAEDSLTFVETAYVTQIYTKSAAQSIVFTDVTTSTTLSKNAPDTLVFVSLADVQRNVDPRVLARGIVDVLEFSQTSVCDSTIHQRTVIDLLIFEQESIKHGTLTGDSSDYLPDLSYWDFVDGKITYILGGLSDKAECDYIPRRTIYQHVTFEQRATLEFVDSTVTPSVAENTLTFSDSCEPFHDILNDTLTFVQASVCEKVAYPIKATLTFTQSADVEFIKQLTAIDTLSFVSTFTYTNIKPCTDHIYSPFLGDGALMSSKAPTTIRKDAVYFTYPFISPTLTLTLRSPEFGNRIKSDYQRVNRESLGGTLQIFADSQWPKVKHFVMEFFSLSETQSQEILTFLQTSLGKEIGFKDHEGRDWRGIINVPENPIIRTSRGYHNCTISVECKQADYFINDELTFTQVNDYVKI